jgi:hypothetical protein
VVVEEAMVEVDIVVFLISDADGTDIEFAWT